MISRIAILFILIGSLASSVYALAQFGIMRTYPVIATVDCNPYFESCFVGDGEDTPEYYKIIEKMAANIPPCNSLNGDCNPLSCLRGEIDCKESTCVDSDECYSVESKLSN